MTARPDARPSPQFAGLESRRATSDQVARAHRHAQRTYSDRRLAAKLDDLLGPIEEEDERA